MLIWLDGNERKTTNLVVIIIHCEVLIEGVAAVASFVLQSVHAGADVKCAATSEGAGAGGASEF